MCTYNTISSQKDRFKIQKRDSEESLLTFVNLYLKPRLQSQPQYIFSQEINMTDKT